MTRRRRLCSVWLTRQTALIVWANQGLDVLLARQVTLATSRSTTPPTAGPSLSRRFVGHRVSSWPFAHSTSVAPHCVSPHSHMADGQRVQHGSAGSPVSVRRITITVSPCTHGHRAWVAL
jgi:hypothetical protein